VKDKIPTLKYRRKSDPIGVTASLKNVFGYDQKSALEDPAIKKPGKQNRRRGTTYKAKKKVARASRKRNRISK